VIFTTTCCAAHDLPKPTCSANCVLIPDGTVRESDAAIAVADAPSARVEHMAKVRMFSPGSGVVPDAFDFRLASRRAGGRLEVTAQSRPQISRGFLPWRLSDDGPRASGMVQRGPSSETLHNTGPLSSHSSNATMLLAIGALVPKDIPRTRGNSRRSDLPLNC